MTVVKVYHDPGHALVRVHDDYIQPPEVREQLLANLARMTYDILFQAELKKLQAEREAKENCTGATTKEEENAADGVLFTGVLPHGGVP